MGKTMMRDTGTYHAKKMRAKVKQATTARTSGKVYRRIAIFKEHGAGTPNLTYYITLKAGWSFKVNEHDNHAIFGNLSEVFKHAHLTYTCGCEECLDTKFAISNGFATEEYLKEYVE